MINVLIDGRNISAERGTTILEAAKGLGIHIPTLCHHEGLPPDGNCRLCTVEVEERGRKKLVASCMYPIKSEIAVSTYSARVVSARRFVVQLLLNRNPKSPAIVKLAEEYGVRREERFAHDSDLCIRCNRCVRACEVNGTNAIGMAMTGFERHVATPYDAEPRDCVGCLSCAEVCPTGKITYKDEGETRRIWGRTFSLLSCERCGAKYATKEQLEHVGRLGADAVLCDRCRKAIYGRLFV